MEKKNDNSCGEAMKNGKRHYRANYEHSKVLMRLFPIIFLLFYLFHFISECQIGWIVKGKLCGNFFSGWSVKLSFFEGAFWALIRWGKYLWKGPTPSNNRTIQHRKKVPIFNLRLLISFCDNETTLDTAPLPSTQK